MKSFHKSWAAICSALTVLLTPLRMTRVRAIWLCGNTRMGGITRISGGAVQRSQQVARAPTTYENSSCSILLFHGEPHPKCQGLCAHYLSHSGQIPSSAPGRNSFAVGDGVRQAGFRKCPQAAAGSCRKRRRRYLRSGSTTKLDEVARPVRFRR